jgi:putative SOS response-associated peptidase YedK
MCGRFTLRTPASVVAEQFALFAMPPFAARFNIAPTQNVPVVRLTPGAMGSLLPLSDSRSQHGADQNPTPQGRASRPWHPTLGRECVLLRWGLIPGWAKDPAIGARLINARAETVAEKPAFRAAFRRRRCLVLADGFYEWQKSAKRKQPFFFHLRDDRPFAFAGLWESWEGGDNSHLETCTILTTEPNDLVATVHDRMPVILAPDAHDAWLDPAVEQPDRLTPLLRPYPAEAMDAYPVGPLVNSPTHDGPGCIERAGTLF